MVKFGFVTLIAAFVGTLALVGLSGDASAGKPCARAKLETKLLGDACKAGGQDEAKKVMKAFVKEAKKQAPDLACQSCHQKLGGDFPLKPDAKKRFTELGGM